jgi:two-component system heavy metal sensor histidine kinase CusS
MGTPATDQKSYSIVGRLCRQVFWQTLIGMGLLCAGIYAAASMFIKAEQSEQIATKVVFMQEVILAAAKRSGEAEVVAKLAYYAPRRPGTFLEVWRADGSLLYRDGNDNGVPGKDWHSVDFETTLPQGAVLHGRFAQDCTQYARMLTGLGITLLFATLAGAALISFGTTWRLQRGLRPLQALACQTRAIAPDRLGDRLELREPVEELQPWIDQFNGLMGRLQRAYVQLEGFNADVAHELRTP